MTSRTITTLGRANQSKLREQFGFRTINEAIENFGLAPKQKKYSNQLKNEAFEIMREQYNLIVNQLNTEVKEKRKTDRTNTTTFLRNFNVVNQQATIQRNKSKPRMTLDKLDKYVSFWTKKNNKQNTAFTIKIQSGVVDIAHTFRFSNIFHFDNWFSRVSNDTTIVASNSYNEQFYENSKDIFNGVLTIEKIGLVSGGCNKKVASTKRIKSSFYDFKLFNPTSKDNNCFFACLKHITGDTQMSAHNLRKQFDFKSGTEISIGQAYTVIKKLELNIEIRDYDTNEELDDKTQYILYQENHYFVVESWEEINKKDKKTKRGLLTFDFETRPTEKFNVIKATGQKMFLLKDSLCCVYYRSYKQTECKNVKFLTNDEKSSARQFIDWLNVESKQGRTYNVIAHNGGKFDFYFFIANLTSKELLESEPHFRGTTIISLNYRGNLFKDSCCFLTDKLSNLSKSFKITDGKMVTMMLHDKEITSEQLCFYRHDLTFNGFMDLQHTDCEFWELYEKYCLYDCISLFQIWEKFTICVNTLVEKINPYLLKTCPLMSSMTIGSHSKKILVEINKCKGQDNYYKKNLETFTGIYYEDKKRKIDYDKYKFLCNFKRGGISHCHKAGKHMTGITGVDIASQYPASLIYAKIPTGKSEWITEHDKTKHGFYLIKNLVFNSYTLKPVALSLAGVSLNWATNDINELYVDSYMLDYIIENYGLKSFDVVKGLVSNTDVDASKIFGKYTNTFYEEKKLQDKYKSTKDEQYNEALRTTIKLYLNSLTGKLVENPAVHYSLKFDDTSTKVLNGQGVSKVFNEDKINDWLVAGIMVYSYSKRLLFEYIKCLPNDSDDVIHIETDGIYFNTQDLPAFTENLNNYKGEYPCKFGEDLGNLKIEKSTPKGQVAYFLGKKFYNITLNDNYLTEARDDGDDNIYRVKGIPQKTIDDDGSPIYLVDTQLYEDVYSGKSIMKSFKTLKKSLFDNNTSIASFTMSRTIKSSGNYKLYQ